MLCSDTFQARPAGASFAAPRALGSRSWWFPLAGHHQSGAAGARVEELVAS